MPWFMKKEDVPANSRIMCATFNLDPLRLAVLVTQSGQPKTDQGQILGTLLTQQESDRLCAMAMELIGEEDGSDVVFVLMRCLRRGLTEEYLEAVAAGRVRSDAQRGAPYGK